MEVADYIWRAVVLVPVLDGGGQKRDEYQEAECLQERLQGAHNGDAPRQDVIPEELDNKQLDNHDERNSQEPRNHLAGARRTALVVHETLRNSGIDLSVHDRSGLFGYFVCGLH
jgi:hypothetical protein